MLQGARYAALTNPHVEELFAPHIVVTWVARPKD